MTTRLLAPLLALLFLAPACDKKEANNASETTTTSKETTAAPDTAKADAKTFTIGFEPLEDRDATKEKAEKLAKFISEESGFTIEVYIPEESGELVEKMGDDDIHLAYFGAWPYLGAHINADADIMVVEDRGGETTHTTTFWARKDAGITKLADLKGKTVGFTSPTSTAGYLFPMLKMIDEGLVERDDDLAKYVSKVVFTGSYPAALRALLAGDVDVAPTPTYAAEAHLTPEERGKLVAVATHGPVPTPGVAIRSDVRMDDREKLEAAFLALNEDANKALLDETIGADGFVKRSHGDHVYTLQQKLEELEVAYPVDD